MFDVKNKKAHRRSQFLVVMLIGFGVFGGVVTSCEQSQSVVNSINENAVKLKKMASDSTKSKQLKPRAKSAVHTRKKIAPHPVVSTNTKSNKIIERPFYNSKLTKLRDPFIPFIKFSEETENGPRKKKFLLPLQRYTLTQLKLIAIIDAGSAGKWAMVQDASGKGYTLKKGMPVGSEGGFVKDIFRDKVIIQQNVVNLLGKKKKKLTAIKLHPEKKGE